VSGRVDRPGGTTQPAGRKKGHRFGRLRLLASVLVRGAQIVAVVARFFLFARFIPERRRLPGSVRARLALEALGGTWIKLGQALALRFDLLPEDFCYEFFKLLNQVTPFSYTDVREIVRQELGQYPESLFTSFEPEPMAAASIGQVHQAVLPTGNAVAVKVQRPAIGQIIATDLALMRIGGWLVDLTHIFGSTRSREVVDEFARWLSDEMDYRVEARHAFRLLMNAEGDPHEVNARVHAKYSSERILTTELIEGIPLIELMYRLRDGDEAYLSDLKRGGYDLVRIAEVIDWNTFNQIYVHGYFHADLHPANLFVLPGNAIGYVDFGIIGNLSSQLRESLLLYIRYLVDEDADGAASELLRWITAPNESDLDAAREDLASAMDDLFFRLRGPGGLSQKGAGAEFALSVMGVARRHRLGLSHQLIAWLKTLVTGDALRYELAPDYDVRAVAQRFLTRLAQTETRRLLRPEELDQTLLEYGIRMRRALTAIDSGVAFEARMGQFLTTVRHRVQALALLALGAGIVFAFLLAKAASGSTTGGLTRGFSLLAIAVVALALLVIIREVRRLPRRPPPRQPGTPRRGKLRATRHERIRIPGQH
jgi:predicted unusual protein kinase regulating ubiquinone biosynthesis (AarF/ABC1/UbiB family)